MCELAYDKPPAMVFNWLPCDTQDKPSPSKGDFLDDGEGEVPTPSDASMERYTSTRLFQSHHFCCVRPLSRVFGKNRLQNYFIPGGIFLLLLIGVTTVGITVGCVRKKSGGLLG